MFRRARSDRLASVEISPVHPDELPAWRDDARERMVRLREGNVPGDPAELVDRALATGGIVLRVSEEGRDLGTAWLLDRGHYAVLADLDVPTDTVPAVCTQLRAEATRRGWDSITFSIFRGDPAAAALATPQTELVATRMGLAVAGVPEASIELRPMTPQRYQRFLAEGIEAYARSIFDAGGYPDFEAARRSSIEQHEELLPDGLHSPGHLLWSAFDPGHPDEEVGMLWIEVRADHGFIYDIDVDPAHQRKGYGTQMLRAGAAQMRERGRNALWLNVFGHNADARRLYEREGYAVNEEIRRLASDGGVG